MSNSDVAVLVTASVVFPGTAADESALLTQLSRDDALCICAKLNAIVSGFAPGHSLYQRQDEAVGFLQLTLRERAALADYATDLLRRRFPDGSGVLHRALRCNLDGTNANREGFQIDAVLNSELTVASVFEIKASWLEEKSILANDPEVFLGEIRKKYSHDPSSGKRKGVAQLARSVGALIRGEWTGPDQAYAGVTSVFPVLLVFDERMGTPGIGHFLESEFRIHLGPVPAGRIVHPVIVLTIFDLEHLVWGVESLSLQVFFRAYSAADFERLSSVHNFISRSAFYNQVGQSEKLEELSRQFMEEAQKEIIGTSDATSASES